LLENIVAFAFITDDSHDTLVGKESDSLSSFPTKTARGAVFHLSSLLGTIERITIKRLFRCEALIEKPIVVRTVRVSNLAPLGIGQIQTTNKNPQFRARIVGSISIHRKGITIERKQTIPKTNIVRREEVSKDMETNQNPVLVLFQ